MKVNITKESRAWMTLDEHEQAKKIVRDMREDESSAREYLEMAARCWLWNSHKTAGDFFESVLSADAEICRNGNKWGAYSDESGCLDIWLYGTVETRYGFLKLGVCLSDVWQIGAEDFNESFPSLCSARYYTEF